MCIRDRFNIAASWNPYENTGGLKVAVATVDEGYEGDLISVNLNLGEQVISALHENTQLDWIFTTKKKAVNGVDVYKRQVEQLSTVPDVSNEINALEDAFDDDTESIITNERYVYISSVVADSCKKNGAKKLTTSDKIDRIVTNRWLCLLYTSRCV